MTRLLLVLDCWLVFSGTYAAPGRAEDDEDDEDGLVSPLLSLAVSLGGVIVTVVSSLLPCDGLPLAEDCDGGGHVPFYLSLDVHLGLKLGFWNNFLLFSGLR